MLSFAVLSFYSSALNILIFTGRGVVKMKKLLLAVPFTLMLTACGAPSVDDLVEDHELLVEITQKCAKLLMEGEDTDTDECNNAQSAQKKIIENMTKGLMKKFG